MIRKGNIVKKNWGHELVISNSKLYCGKILHFNKNSKFSMHFHVQKIETWYVSKGKLKFRYIDTKNAGQKEHILNVGDIVDIKPLVPHQLEALEESDVFEISTEHFDNDSYRVLKGDSQMN